MDLFEDKDKGCNITKKIGKDIKKRKQTKSKERGKTNKSYFIHQKNDNTSDIKKDNNELLDDDKKMDIDPK